VGNDVLDIDLLKQCFGRDYWSVTCVCLERHDDVNGRLPWPSLAADGVGVWGMVVTYIIALLCRVVKVFTLTTILRYLI
jgi:hypothetical protein